MNFKKTLGLVMTALIATSTGVGCGNKDNGSTTSSNSQQSSGEVTIVYSRGKDTTPANGKLVEKFNELHKGKIKVEIIDMPSDTGKQHDQYVTVFNAKGTDYDVFDADVIWPAEFAQAGYALPLDKFVERDGINLKDYMQGPVQAVTPPVTR